MSVKCAYTFDQLLVYSDAEDARWHKWFTANRAALDVAFADGRLATVTKQWGHDMLLSDLVM